MKTITEYIFVENSAIGSDFENKVYNKLLAKKGTCSQQNGYIIDVSDVFEILSIQISNAGDGMYAKVRYSYDGFKPKVGDKLTGVVSQISKYGIAILYNGLLTTTISASSLKSYTYNSEAVSFSKDAVVISNGSSVAFTVSVIRFANNNYTCVGVLD